MCGGGSVAQVLQPLADIGTAVFAPEALPYVMGAQGVYDASQGNWAGAALSGLGAGAAALGGVGGAAGGLTDSAITPTMSAGDLNSVMPAVQGSDVLAGSGATATALDTTGAASGSGLASTDVSGIPGAAGSPSGVAATLTAGADTSGANYIGANGMTPLTPAMQSATGVTSSDLTGLSNNA